MKKSPSWSPPLHSLTLALLVGLTGCDLDSGRDSSSVPSVDAERPRPNVVWILLDACRPDHLSAYGYRRPTSPNIDQLAGKGARFNNHFAQAPNTIPSVASYMTGRFEPVGYQDARHTDIWFLRRPPPEEMLVSSILSESGYSTAMFSSSPWFTSESRLAKSFDRFGSLAHGPALQDRSFVDRYPELFASLAHGPALQERSFVDRNPELFTWLREHSEHPFFLYLHSLDTHEPRYRNNTLATWLDPGFPSQRDSELRNWKGTPFSEADIDHLRDLYDGGIAYADNTVGELVEYLDALGVLENTLFIIGSDHGEMLGDDGKSLGHPADQTHDDLLRVPLILSGPGISPGKTVSSRTQNVDIAPTLVDLLSITTGASFDGKSLKPLLENERAGALHEFIFARFQNFLSNTEHNRVIILGNSKFVSHIDGATEVWKMPDLLGQRRRGNPSARERSRIREILKSQLLPKWQQKKALPKEAPPLAEIGHRLFGKEDLVTRVHSRTDGRWSRWKSEVNLFLAKEFLIGFPSTEDLPELSLTRKLPTGTYDVEILLETLIIDKPPLIWCARPERPAAPDGHHAGLRAGARPLGYGHSLIRARRGRKGNEQAISIRPEAAAPHSLSLDDAVGTHLRGVVRCRPALWGRNGEGPSSVSIGFRAESETAYRLFRLQPARRRVKRRWFHVGTYQVDNLFSYAVRPGLTGDLAAAGRLRFRIHGSSIEAPAAEQLQEELERFRALGYVK